jgi:beta-N-acetylhexosaminidase
MLSNATYVALDPSQPAVFSRRIVRDLLRDRIGFGGVTISDALSAPGVASPTTAARATQAGIDILLYVDEQVSARAFREVVAGVRAGTVSREGLEASARRIRELRR